MSGRADQDPDLGVLTARLFLSVQDELFRTLAEQGFADLRPRHGAVFAYLDENGVRASELARRSGQHKQIIGTIIDELEALGYVERRPDPADRRAKLVVPTARGRQEMRTAASILSGIEARHAEHLGEAEYRQLKAALRRVADHQRATWRGAG